MDLLVKDNRIVVGITRYNNCMHKVYKLNYVELYWLFHLTERANSDCKVRIDKESREEFIKFTSDMSNGQLIYADRTVINATEVLKKNRFLLRTERNGVVFVNPKYFFNGSWGQRKFALAFVEKRVEEINNTKQTNEEIKEYIDGK